jgi:hypothetical protein
LIHRQRDAASHQLPERKGHVPHVKQLVENELEDLLEIECRTREFVEIVEQEMATSELRGDKQPPFATRTISFVEEVKPHLEALDVTRSDKSG